MVVLHRSALSRLIIGSLFTALAIAEIMNRTIDDTFGDSQTGLKVTYLPVGNWHDQSCGGCAIRPNVTQAFNMTYTAATYFQSLGSINITMHFNGTAIYVFFILANKEGFGITTFTQADFVLDGNPPQSFQHSANLETSSFEFNQLVFSQTNLINTQHTLVIVTSGLDEHVYVNFDYAIYTHDDNTTLTPPTTSSTGGSVLPTTTLIFANPTTTASPVAPEVTVTVNSIPLPSAAALGSFSNVRSGKASIAGLIACSTLFFIALIFSLIYVYILRRRIKQSNARESKSVVTAQHRTVNRGNPVKSDEVVEKELRVSDTKQQLGLMREESTYLKDQKHSTWEHRFSDGLLPGYASAKTSSTSSGPLSTVVSSGN